MRPLFKESDDIYSEHGITPPGFLILPLTEARSSSAPSCPPVGKAQRPFRLRKKVRSSISGASLSPCGCNTQLHPKRISNDHSDSLLLFYVCCCFMFVIVLCLILFDVRYCFIFIIVLYLL